MTDVIDKAQEIEQRERDEAIFKAMQKVQISNEGRENCQNCGEVIPEARRKANPCAVRCIACQEKFERGGK